MSPRSGTDAWLEDVVEVDRMQANVDDRRAYQMGKKNGGTVAAWKGIGMKTSDTRGFKSTKKNG